jgi:hypothetical protein
MGSSIAGYTTSVATILGLFGILIGLVVRRTLNGRSPSWATFFGATVFVGAWVAGVALLNAGAPESLPARELKHWIEKDTVFKRHGDLVKKLAEKGMATHVSEQEIRSALVILIPIGNFWILESGLLILAFFVWIAACAEAWQSRRAHIIPALTLAYSAAVLQLVLWILIFPMLVFELMRTTVTQSEIDLFKTNWTLLGGQYVLAAALAGVAVVTWLRRVYLASQTQAKDRWREYLLPRLLVANWFQAGLIAVIVIGSVFFLCSVKYDPDDHWLEPFPGQRIIEILAPVFVLLTTLVPASGMRAGLHIVADVINHFHFVCDQGTKEMKFPIRHRIEARFRSVLVEVLKSTDTSRLVILAHSQGTVAVLDVLRQEDTMRMLLQKDVRLMTMGSPFTHLYQQYFPTQYPPLDASEWTPLRTWVSSEPVSAKTSCRTSAISSITRG